MEGKRRQKRYRRLDRAERAAIQNGLERGWSCRRMARELGRSPSTVADEWIGYIFLDDFGRTKPAFLNSTGVMYPSVECILKLLYQCT